VTQVREYKAYARYDLSPYLSEPWQVDTEEVDGSSPVGPTIIFSELALSAKSRASFLKNGDRVALLGRGIAVVQQAQDEVAVVVLGNGVSARIARKDIVLNKQNMRWECEANSPQQ